MKQNLLFFFAVLSLFGIQAARISQTRNINQAKNVTVTLDSTDNVTIYVQYPHVSGIGTSDDQDPDTSIAAVALSTAIWSMPRKVTVSIIADTLTGASTDSLKSTLHALSYNASKDSFYLAQNDSLFLVFDTRVTYTATAYDELDWTHGRNYICILNESSLWGSSGLALKLWQTAKCDATEACNRFYVSFYFEY